MRLYHVSHLALAAVLGIVSADDPAPTPPGPRMPPLPSVLPLPTPMPAADAAVTLEPGVEFLIDYSDELLVAAFPPGVLKIRHRKVDAGHTLVLPGKFIDLETGTKVVDEEREFKGPCHLYRVTAAAEGEAWLVIAVVGQKTFQSRHVITGKGPRPPPPVDPVDPPVKPPVVPPKPAQSFQVLLVYESGDTITAAQNSVLYGKAVEDYLTARCTGGKAGWGRREKDTDPAADTSKLKGLWAAVKPKVTSTPAIAVAVDNKVTLEPFPATPAEAVTLLEKYREGK